MEFGVCLNVIDSLRQGAEKLEEQLAAIAAAGYAYVEVTAVSFADAGDDEIAVIRAALAKHGLMAKRACILFPGTLKVVGPEKNEENISGYLQKLMPKLKAVGMEIIVFGSGGARRIPDGFPYEEAFDQFCESARLTADIAGEYGIRVALEHLNAGECNLLISVEETVKAVRQANHPGCGLLFDIYHVRDPEDLRYVVAGKDVLFHSHTSHPTNRLYPAPGDEECLRPYFAVLKAAGYDGTVSVEANLHGSKSFSENMTDAYQLLTSF